MSNDQTDCDSSSNMINSLQEEYNDKHFNDIAEALELKYRMYNRVARSRRYVTLLK